MFKQIIITILIISPIASITFQELNYQLETLNDNFQQNFNQYLNNGQFNSTKQQGQLLYMLGKMYLYGYDQQITQGRYMLAYFFFKVSAQLKQYPQSYYYLSVMYFYRLIPDSVIAIQLKKDNNIYQDIIQILKSSHLSAVENNLYFSSLLGHDGASTILGSLYKDGIGLQKNCTSSLAYYLSVIRNTYVDIYEYRPSLPDYQNFEKQLYSKKTVSFQHLGQDDINVIQRSEFYDQDTIHSNYQIALNFYHGRNGYIRNFTKAAQIFKKLSEEDHLHSRSMLGSCYMRGHGVPLDRKIARKLYKQSQSLQSSQLILIAMDYFGMDGPSKKQDAINALLKRQKESKKKLGPLFKYLLGSLIVKGQIPNRSKDDGIIMLQQSSHAGNSMAKIIMGLLFIDGLDINYDCWRSVKYLSQQIIYRNYFMDKYQIAKIAIKKNKFEFALIKYFELTMAGDQNSFINSLYLLNMYQKQSLPINKQSWIIPQQNYIINKLYKKNIIPNIKSYIIKQYNSIKSIQTTLKFTQNNINKYLQADNNQLINQHINYIKYKIITIGSKTKGNSLLKLYQYKNLSNYQLLNTIANDNNNGNKLHVMQARYLLGKYYQQKDYKFYLQNLQKIQKFGEINNNTAKIINPMKRALQQYKLATKSEILAKIIYFIQGGSIQINVLNDLYTYLTIVSIILLLLYIKRSRRLNQIYHQQLKKQRQNEKQDKQKDILKQNQQRQNNI